MSDLKLANRLKNLGTETAYAVSSETFELKSRGHTVFPFHIGDLNFPTAAPIVEATKKALDEGRTRYCNYHGVQELREVIAEYAGKERGIHLSASMVSVQPGGKPVIPKFLTCTMNAGDEVLYPTPGYPIYESQIEFLGGVGLPYTFVKRGDRFCIDMDALRRKITPKTRCLIYNNYQNPTGAVSSKEEMREIASIAVENNLWVLSDEAYFHLVFDDIKPLSIISYEGMRERTVILLTTSKSWAMTGWRLGAAIGPVPLIEQICKLSTNDEGCTNHFIQWGAMDAFIDRSGLVAKAQAEMLNELHTRRNLLHSLINEVPGFSAFLPAATFYLYVNVTAAFNILGSETYEDFRLQILKDTGVSFCTREHFGRVQTDEKERYVRFAYSGSRIDHIEQGMAALKTYMTNKLAEKTRVPKPRVFVTRNIPSIGIELLEDVADIEIWDGDDAPPREVLLAKVKNCDGLVSMLTDRIDDELLSAASRLKIVSQFAVGFDNIDLASCTRHGVAVTNTPNVLTDAVVETTFGLLFSASRRLVECDRYVRRGDWKVSWHPLMKLGVDLKGKIFGILGLGRIGCRVAKLAHEFGAFVYYYDVDRNYELEEKIATYVSFDDLCRKADFLSIHAPLNKNTFHIINESKFALMKPSLVLVNTSRGPIIDQAALVTALREKRIFSAAIDVYEDEPIADDDPLLLLDNVTLAPHIGSASLECRRDMACLVARNQLAFWAKKPLLSLVNKDWDDKRQKFFDLKTWIVVE